MESKTVWLKHHLNSGVPTDDDFEIRSSTVNEDDVKEGQVLVQVKFMSVDPYLRGAIKDDGKSEGERPMEGFVSGVVVSSKSSRFEKGDLFGGRMSFSTYSIVDEKSIWKLTGLIEEDKLSYGIGVMGMPGSTAYGGVSGILRPEKEGETMFVSAASGAVGSIVGQIAKNVYKLNVIGSCGGEKKVALIKEKFGYDHAIDYKTVENAEQLEKKIKECAPDGIDMYFENVGGMHIEAAMSTLKPDGRVAICGLISGYNDEGGIPPSEIHLSKMIYTCQRIEGFVCWKWLSGEKGSFFKDMSTWLKEGKVSGIEETFYDGIDSWPKAFASLFQSGSSNVGKVVVRI